MRDSFYKSPALSALTLVSLAFIGLAQPATAQMTGYQGAGGGTAPTGTNMVGTTITAPPVYTEKGWGACENEDCAIQDCEASLQQTIDSEEALGAYACPVGTVLVWGEMQTTIFPPDPNAAPPTTDYLVQCFVEGACQPYY